MAIWVAPMIFRKKLTVCEDVVGKSSVLRSNRRDRGRAGTHKHEAVGSNLLVLRTTDDFPKKPSRIARSHREIIGVTPTTGDLS